MPCQIEYSEDGEVTIISCGPEPKPKDHECDALGPMKQIETGLGDMHSATCSKCGRPAFNIYDVWD